MILSVTIAEVSNPELPFILQGQPYVESLKQVAAYGYQAVEIQLPDAKDLDREAFFSCCEQQKIRLVSIATGLAVQEGMSLSSHNKAVREQTVERMRGMIDLAAECGHHPDVMIGLLAGKERDCPNRESFLDNLGCSLKKVSDYAKEKGVGVNLEPVNHLDCPGLNTWDEAVELLDCYGCAWIRLGMDLYHMNISETDLLGTIKRFGNRIGCVQLMDRNRYVPGRGDFIFEPIIEMIKGSGFDGPITMECLPFPDPNVALREAAAFYHQYF